MSENPEVDLPEAYKGWSIAERAEFAVYLYKVMLKELWKKDKIADAISYEYDDKRKVCKMQILLTDIEQAIMVNIGQNVLMRDHSFLSGYIYCACLNYPAMESYARSQVNKPDDGKSIKIYKKM